MDCLAAKRHATNAKLVHLKSLTKLKKLQLRATKVTGPGLVNLQGMKDLRSLNFNECGITDEGLGYLKGLDNLERLELWSTKITDAGLANVKGMKKLLTLNLVIDSKKDRAEVVHFTASASEEEIGKPKEVKLGPAGPVTPVVHGSWISLLKKTNSYDQVTLSVYVKRRTASGLEIPINFQTAAPDGGIKTVSYKDEGVEWARTPFSHGSKHAVPIGSAKFQLRVSERGSAFIRPTFYADNDSSRNAIVRARLPALLNPLNPSVFLSEGSPSAEAAHGYKKDVSTGKALVPVSDASPDHDPPISEHWTSKGGNNTPQAIRENWNKSLGTYKIISLPLNLRLNSRGARFTEAIGINFRGPGE